MRLWSLHPRYLDARGLVALWREGLLARKVLHGQTRGYKHHPQLQRFRDQPDPLAAIDKFLHGVRAEAAARGYHFDGRKINNIHICARIPVTDRQMLFELQHLKRKLKIRDKSMYRALAGVKEPNAHPLFAVVAGKIEPWEKT